MLCQAKLKNKKDKWHGFSDKQKEVLPDRMDFTSLALYSYADKNRTELNPIDWKICKNQFFSDIEKSLKTNDLSELKKTTEIINQLGLGKIGTRDNETIKEIISPSVNQQLSIMIYWKNNIPKTSGGREIVLQRNTQNIEQKIHIRQSN